MSKYTEASLGDKIRTATTAETVLKLVDSGKEYTLASSATRRRWARLGGRRIAELSTPAPAAPAESAKKGVKK